VIRYALPLLLAAAAYGQPPGKVLIIGDSISMGYTEPVKMLLAARADVQRIGENGGPTSNGVAHIAAWLGEGHYDVISFNFGLHDLKLDSGKHQVETEQYKANLNIILEALRKTGAKLVWVTTTPVPDGKLNPPRARGDVERYNAAAMEVLRGKVDAVCDLYEAVLPRETELQLKENVHFNPAGYEFLATRVATVIESQLHH
jgi:lysophospholipase L1-like esterase